MTCKDTMSGKAAFVTGQMIALAVTPHEIKHHEERPCWWGRVEFVAFVSHVLGLRPEDMAKVAARIADHVETKCQCPPRPRPPEGW